MNATAHQWTAALATGLVLHSREAERAETTVWPLAGSGLAANPAGVAAVEARSVLGWKQDELFVLSLGCTEEILDVPMSAGYKHLLLKSTELFMRGQSRASAGTAKLLSGHSEANPRYFRYQPVVPGGRFALDRVEMVD